jgi:tetratricopeptide (TPR) repeat protein
MRLRAFATRPAPAPAALASGRVPGFGSLLLALALAVALPTDGRAQVPTLDRVDSLVTAGEYERARDILDQWWSARDEFEIPGSDKARALMLRAQLAPDLETAEPDYLAVVLGYPTSPHAPEALLRLGQGLLADGDATRAAAYLERLVADYPGRPQRTPGLLWLARASAEARRYQAACAAARQGLQSTNDPDLRAMLQVEAGAACSVRAEPAEAEPATGDYAVQTGAFRYRRSATELMERLQEAGHEPRLVRVPRNDLLRVRVGRFQTAEEAESLVTTLRDQGFDAMVVSDAGDEREP